MKNKPINQDQNKENKKYNHLLEKFVEIFQDEDHRGKVLDLGCGDGKTGKRIFDLGFSVSACDMDKSRFEFHKKINFKEGNLNDPLPYNDESFDYIIFMEVIEHIYNPGFVISEISRVLCKGGKLIISTPNIMNISSRLRFLFEGSFDFFREPTLDYARCFPRAIQNMHVIPWRYQELEYLLDCNKLEVNAIFTDKKKLNFISLYWALFPIMFFQSKARERKARKRGGVKFKRINKIIISKDMLLGRHLIIEATKEERAK